jgi:Flp pilus assembly protein TadB
MLYKLVSVVLVVLLLHASVTAQQLQSSTQSIAKMQQTLRTAQEKDKTVKVTLNRKIENRNKLKGRVSEISDTGFTLIEQQTEKSMVLDYADVRHVSGMGMSRAAKVAIGIGIGIVAFMGVGIAVCYARGPCRD